MPEKHDELRDTIAEKMKKMVRNNVKEHLVEPEDNRNIINFGLSITQIKNVSTPNKDILKKEKEKVKGKLDRKIRTRVESKYNQLRILT